MAASASYMWHDDEGSSVKHIHDAVIDDITKPHSMGTTIMAVEFAGGVVMGADSRTTTGSYIANRISDKITPIHERIYCCRSGSAADTQAISDIVRNYVGQYAIQKPEGELPEVAVAARLFKELCYQNKGALMAGIICAGWDKRNGGCVYNIPLGGSLHRQAYAMSGSGSTYIYGYCDANFKEGMSREDCRTFVINALSLAMARDGSSGGVIRICIIDENGVQREMLPGDKLPVHYEKD